MDKPSNTDWNMADLLCNVFKPFYDATNVVSGTLYPIANQCFYVLSEVKGKNRNFGITYRYFHCSYGE